MWSCFGKSADTISADVLVHHVAKLSADDIMDIKLHVICQNFCPQCITMAYHRRGFILHNLTLPCIIAVHCVLTLTCSARIQGIPRLWPQVPINTGGPSEVLPRGPIDATKLSHSYCNSIMGGTSNIYTGSLKNSHGEVPEPSTEMSNESTDGLFHTNHVGNMLMAWLLASQVAPFTNMV